MSNTDKSQNSSSDQILQLVTKVLGQQNEAMTGIKEALKTQTSAISHQPSKRDLLNTNLIAAVLLAIAIVIGTTISYQSGQQAADAAEANRAIGATNQVVVDTFCAAQPDLPECTTSGSPTSKATSILTACRFYETLLTATPADRRVALNISKGCSALGFNIPTV